MMNNNHYHHHYQKVQTIQSNRKLVIECGNERKITNKINISGKLGVELDHGIHECNQRASWIRSDHDDDDWSRFKEKDGGTLH